MYFCVSVFQFVEVFGQVKLGKLSSAYAENIWADLSEDEVQTILQNVVLQFISNITYGKTASVSFDGPQKFACL